MNKVGRIRIDQGNFVSLNLNSCCFEHGDVTWDCSKGRNSRKQESFLEKEFLERLGKAISSC
jgi:hypothetical protein